MEQTSKQGALTHYQAQIGQGMTGYEQTADTYCLSSTE